MFFFFSGVSPMRLAKFLKDFIIYVVFWLSVIDQYDRMIHPFSQFPLSDENSLVLQSSFGFVDYYDRRSAALAIMTLHGRHM
jgi:hypothetical protein